MSDNKQKTIEKERLLKEYDLLLDELGRRREQMQAEVDTDLDEGDAEIFEREKNAALIAVIEAKMQDVQSALRSIEKGNYGICNRCGQPIEPGRLEVKPDAILCLKCQTEVERLNRRGRPQRQIQW